MSYKETPEYQNWFENNYDEMRDYFFKKTIEMKHNLTSVDECESGRDEFVESMWQNQ